MLLAVVLVIPKKSAGGGLSLVAATSDTRRAEVERRAACEPRPEGR